jgi:hypothetical protein
LLRQSGSNGQPSPFRHDRARADFFDAAGEYRATTLIPEKLRGFTLFRLKVQ